jgi:hypothetical protein
MRKDILRRLAALEARHNVRMPVFDLWIDEGDGLLRQSTGEDSTGQVMTREAFNAAFPDAKKIRLNIFDKQIEP